MPGSDKQTLAAAAWTKVCHNLDGLAIGTSVAALDATRTFDRLLGTKTPLPVADLARECGLSPGYANLAFRLLALQGFVARTGDVPAGRAEVALTDAGRDWAGHRAAYAEAPAQAAAARDLLSDLQAGDTRIFVPAEAATGLPERVQLHILGPMAAATMTGLARNGAFDRLTADDGAGVTDLGGTPEAISAAVSLLTAQGWVRHDGTRILLTDEGRVAATMAPQYFYPASYLATLAAVPGLLTGRGTPEIGRGDDGIEGHVDRELDIAFSGLVFARTCRTPFLEAALPLFDAPLEMQPRAVVDCGAGDGTLLGELFDAIVGQTMRGRHLATHPLTMIGVEYNPVAERILAERLADRGVPAHVFAGDIGDPAAIAERLRALGFARDDVLHVNKSVIHNRRFVGAGKPASGAASRGAFVGQDGALIAASEMEADLRAHLSDWCRHLGRHGMIAVEAHIVDEAAVAARIGRGIHTSLEANHGYSNQYLVEAGVHRRAAEAAGLKTRRRHDIGVAFMGAPIMTVDHYDG